MSDLSSIANLSLPDLADDELPELRAMAEAIWLEAYRELIGEAQIRYMLRWMYDPARLREEREREGRRLRWIVAGSTRAGYLGHDRPGAGSEMSLHKFYLRAEHRASGLAAEAMERLAAEAVAAGALAIVLRVNRGNWRAIRFYGKCGFRVVGDDRLEIGGGFVMDDHLMRRDFGDPGEIRLASGSQP